MAEAAAMTVQEEKSKRYGSLDGLRAYAIIGIVLMHVYTNSGYQIGGFLFNSLIPAFTNFVFLFMMVSGFGMCCGYFDKILEHRITLEEFYSKRYAKIWPFFALLCILDWVMSPSVHTLYEVFANLTLCQELLPNANIQVIGVSWTLGVIFVFYLLFPFFCYLLSRKKRAWLTFAVALIFHMLCIIYFFDANHVPENFSARTSFIYCAVYFVMGGLVYLYRDKLSEIADKYRFALFFMCIVLAVLYFVVGASIVTILPLSAALLIYAIGRSDQRGILCNPVTKFISGISFEVYLCHMAVYRVLEKCGFIHLFGNEFISYCLTAMGTIGGSILFSLCAKWVLGKAAKLIKQFKEKSYG